MFDEMFSVNVNEFNFIRSLAKTLRANTGIKAALRSTTYTITIPVMIIGSSCALSVSYTHPIRALWVSF